MERIDEIIKLSKALISIPSVSGDIPKAVEVIELTKQQLADFSPQIFVSQQFPSLLYTNKPHEIKNFKIIFNTHLDVVPAGEQEFIPREENGRLYGRGAYDTKAAAAVMLLLFKEMAPQLSYPLGLQITTDEELNGFNGTKYQLDQGVRAEFAIASECNNNFQVGNRAKGRMSIRLSFKGDAAHAAYPWRGENAVWAMYQVLEPLMRAFPIPEEETYETTVTITKIESDNQATNRVPDNCSAHLDIRYKPDQQNEIVQKIRSLLPDSIMFEPEEMAVPHYADENDKYVQLLRNITTEVIGEELPFRFAHATSDARFFSAIGSPAVEYGPLGKSPHHYNEWVDIKSLGQFYEILKKFLLAC
jgi:succinyl-diaminopimelate desuccinylase